MKSFEKPLATSARKSGLNVNLVMLLFVMAMIPDLEFWNRLAFLFVVVAFAFVVVQLHQRLIPNTVVYLTTPKSNIFGRALPTILSWSLALSSALAAAIIYGLLSGELPELW